MGTAGALTPFLAKIENTASKPDKVTIHIAAIMMAHWRSNPHHTVHFDVQGRDKMRARGTNSLQDGRSAASTGTRGMDGAFAPFFPKIQQTDKIPVTMTMNIAAATMLHYRFRQGHHGAR